MWHTKKWISLCKVLRQSCGNIFQIFGTVVVILLVKTRFLELLHWCLFVRFVKEMRCFPHILQW